MIFVVSGVGADGILWSPSQGIIFVDPKLTNQHKGPGHCRPKPRLNFALEQCIPGFSQFSYTFSGTFPHFATEEARDDS